MDTKASRAFACYVGSISKSAAFLAFYYFSPLAVGVWPMVWSRTFRPSLSLQNWGEWYTVVLIPKEVLQLVTDPLHVRPFLLAQVLSQVKKGATIVSLDVKLQDVPNFKGKSPGWCFGSGRSSFEKNLIDVICLKTLFYLLELSSLRMKEVKGMGPFDDRNGSKCH